MRATHYEPNHGDLFQRHPLLHKGRPVHVKDGIVSTPALYGHNESLAYQSKSGAGILASRLVKDIKRLAKNFVARGEAIDAVRIAATLSRSAEYCNLTRRVGEYAPIERGVTVAFVRGVLQIDEFAPHVVVVTA